jgi:hypothetical protein
MEGGTNSHKSTSASRSRTEDSLRRSYALIVHWQQRIDANDVQAEMDRMANDAGSPEMLGELWC